MSQKEMDAAERERFLDEARRRIDCKSCHAASIVAGKGEDGGIDIASLKDAGWKNRRGWMCPACVAKLPKEVVVHARGDLKVVELGKVSFGGRIVVCDPCYEGREGGEMDAMPGEWTGYAVIRDARWFGMGPETHERTVMLVAAHASVALRYRALMRFSPLDGLSRTTGGRGVDSGQMAIFDASADMSGGLYEECCEKSELGGIVGGKAFASDTCLGDGGYPVSFWRRADGGVAAVAARFWGLSARC